jgi:PAS domain S-box-containing protein
VLHPQRGLRWLYGTGRVQRSADGTPQRLSGISIDITERKAAEAERERLAAIVRATPDFVAMADAEERVLYLNPAARSMIGVRDDEDIGRLSISDFHPQEAQQLIRGAARPAAVRDGAWQGENILLGRDGRHIPVSQVIVAHRDGDGSVLAYSTVVRDLSERKATERALREKEAFQHAILTSAG